MKEFEALLKQLGTIMKEQNLLFTASFSATLELTSTDNQVSQYVDNFDLFYIFFDGTNDVTQFGLAHAQNEFKPSIVKEKQKNIMKWGIPPSKLVRKIV